MRLSKVSERLILRNVNAVEQAASDAGLRRCGSCAGAKSEGINRPTHRELIYALVRAGYKEAAQVSAVSTDAWPGEALSRGSVPLIATSVAVPKGVRQLSAGVCEFCWLSLRPGIA